MKFLFSPFVAPLPNLTPAQWATVGVGAAVIGREVYNQVSDDRSIANGSILAITRDETTTPVTHLTQGSNVPAVVRSRRPGEQSTRQYPPRSRGTARNHIPRNVETYVETHVMYNDIVEEPRRNRRHVIAQSNRAGNIERAHLYQEQTNPQNPNRYERLRRIDMTGPAHSGVPTPHIHDSWRERPRPLQGRPLQEIVRPPRRSAGWREGFGGGDGFGRGGGGGGGGATW